MKKEELFERIGDVDENYVKEADDMMTRKKVKWLPRAVAACAAAVIFAMVFFLPFGGGSVTAYAYGTEQEITSTGAAFTTGKIDANGTLTGHPLLFHLAGEGIDTVRFSCKNGQLNFIDLSEQRDEYGFAQNFTVSYGEDSDEYPSLLIDWLPSQILEALNSGATTMADLPEETRQDVIVMEITFTNGRSATKAITISLDDNGTFHAAFGEYKVSDSDGFVRRADSAPIPRETLYEQGEITVMFYDREGGEVLPEGNWYDTANIDRITVQWNGRAPEMVQMLFTPAGTETATLMDFLSTEAVSAENKVVISAEPLHQDSLMGHLQFVLNFGSSTITSGYYNVIFNPEG